MYHHHHHHYSSSSSSNHHLDPSLFPPPPTITPQIPGFYGVDDIQPPSSFMSPASSSYYDGIQGSNSTLSLSLPHHTNTTPEYYTTPPSFYHHHHHQRPPPSSSSPSSSSGDFYDSPVRRVFSTGDLQGMPASSAGENEGGGGGGKVGRYSAEERKEKIEKYRNKRNQRNFHKKITYACRKTLADSRPRIRGRFARNGETEMEGDQGGAAAAEMSSYGDSGNNYDSSDLWRQMLGTTDEEDRCGYDDDLLATFVDVFSVNLLS